MYRKKLIKLLLYYPFVLILILSITCKKEPPPIEKAVQITIGSTGEESLINVDEWDPIKLYDKEVSMGYTVYLLETDSAMKCSMLNDSLFEHCQISITKLKSTNIHELGFKIKENTHYCIYYVAFGEDGDQFDISYHENPISFPFEQADRNFFTVNSLLNKNPINEHVRVTGRPRFAKIIDGEPPMRKTDWILEGTSKTVYVSGIFNIDIFSNNRILIVGILKKTNDDKLYLEGVDWRPY